METVFECPLCGQKLFAIGGHPRKHNMTNGQYIKVLRHHKSKGVVTQFVVAKHIKPEEQTKYLGK